MATLLRNTQRSTSQSFLRHRPDQDQPPHPPSFNTVMHPPGFHTALLSSLSPRKGTHTTFNLKASLKGLYGGLSGTDCFLPATSTPAIAPARNQTQPFAVQKALPGSRQRRFWPHTPWRTFRLDPEHLGVSSCSRDTCSRLVVSNLLPPQPVHVDHFPRRTSRSWAVQGPRISSRPSSRLRRKVSRSALIAAFSAGPFGVSSRRNLKATSDRPAWASATVLTSSWSSSSVMCPPIRLRFPSGK